MLNSQCLELKFSNRIQIISYEPESHLFYLLLVISFRVIIIIIIKIIVNEKSWGYV